MIAHNINEGLSKPRFVSQMNGAPFGLLISDKCIVNGGNFKDYLELKDIKRIEPSTVPDSLTFLIYFVGDSDVLVNNECEEFVRYCCKEKAEEIQKANGLVRGMKNGISTRGAKWISDANGKCKINAAGSIGHEYKVTIKVKKGTTQWLKDNGIPFEVTGGEKDVMKKVLIKSAPTPYAPFSADLIKKL